MKRYPDGWQGKNFFQKNAPSHMPEWIERAPFPASTREGEKKIIDYAVVNDDLALLWMANMGCIDLHTWASRVDKPERPDWVMFDLDPSEGAGVRGGDRGRAAREGDARPARARELPEDVGLARDPRARPDRPAAHVRGGARVRRRSSPARSRGRIPASSTTEWAKQKRTRRARRREPERAGGDERDGVLGAAARRRARVDAAALGRGDVRPRPGGFTMEAVLDRVARHGDLFAGALGGKQSLKAALKSLPLAVAELPRMPEHRELDDVAAEEERDRPVDDDAQLPREQRELVQVVRPRDEPAGEAPEVQARDARRCP